MASKRQPPPWTAFDLADLRALALLAKAPRPDNPDAALARHLARWFEGAAELLASGSLPPQERERLLYVVRTVAVGPVQEDADDRRLAILHIINEAAAYTPAPLPPDNTDGDEFPKRPNRAAPWTRPGADPLEGLSIQQRWALACIRHFAALRPDDGPWLVEEGLEHLLAAVPRWLDSKAGRKKGQPRGPLSDDQRQGKYHLIARGIDGTSFKCSADELRKLWDRKGAE